MGAFRIPHGWFLLRSGRLLRNEDRYYASGRTANAARKSLDAGLKIAFRSGAVMGLTVVGLGLLDIAIWFIVLNGLTDESLIAITTTMLTFGMGASTQALLHVSVVVSTRRLPTLVLTS